MDEFDDEIAVVGADLRASQQQIQATRSTES